MSALSWTENVRCPQCRNTGKAHLTEIGSFKNRFDHVPAGFKVVTNHYGSDLYCEACNIPAAP